MALGSGGPAVYVNGKCMTIAQRMILIISVTLYNTCNLTYRSPDACQFATDGGQYADGGGNTATNNQGGKDCEGVLAKTECELVFTKSDEAKVEGTTEAEEGEGLKAETEKTIELTDNSTNVVLEPTMSPIVGNAKLHPTMVPTTSPILITAEPTETSFQTPSESTPTSSSSMPTMRTTFVPTNNATLFATDEKAGKNAIEPPNSSNTTSILLTLVNFEHADGALGLCEGDCNQDNDCKGRLRCFKRVDNGGWRTMAVPGCEADENHPMRKVDYCYDPFASTATEIGRGDPETDPDPVVDSGVTIDESPGVSPAPSVSSTTTKPALAPVIDETTTAEPSGLPTLHPVAIKDSSTTEKMEPTQSPGALPVSGAPTAAPVTPEPSSSLVSDPPIRGPSASPVSAPPTSAPVTAEPSVGPTASPVQTLPTSSPTKGPTSEYIDNSEPDKPQGGYFNYDLKSDYGPRKWHKVKPQKTEEYNYWKEFKDVIKEDLDKNYCDSSAQQSPINVFDAGGTCLEYHQIRDRVRTYAS